MTTINILRRALMPTVFGVLVLAGSVAAGMAAVPDPVPAAQAGTARVWFLRPTTSASGDDSGAAPMLYADGAPIAPIPANAAYYRDFTPGTHTFTIEPYALPTDQSDTVMLVPGSQNYVEVEWAPAWQFGYPSGSRGANSHSFFVVNFPTRLAQAYLPTLNDLGSR